jgi:hypothetical protein
MTQRQNQNQPKKNKTKTGLASKSKERNLQRRRSLENFLSAAAVASSLDLEAFFSLPAISFAAAAALFFTNSTHTQNPKTFQKERERHGERERDFQVSCSAAHYAEPPTEPFAEPEPHAEPYTEPEPEPDPELYAEPCAHCRTSRRSLNPSLLPCISHLTRLFRALANFRASGSETQL